MSSKTKYSFIGIIILAAALIGYHFHGASQAEEQIVQLIEEQTAANSSISVQHSSVEVTPFTGKIIISDLTIVLEDHIERAKQLTVDLTYFDVLKFYLGGTEYALEHLYQAEALFVEPSYVNKSNLQQVSSDNLHVNFQGQALDAIRAAIADTSFSEEQKIQAEGSGLRIQFPGTLITGLKAQEFRYNGSIASGKKYFGKEGQHSVVIDSLSWTPFEAFQNKYGFFIKGFGYPTDDIPFESAVFRSVPQQQSNRLKVESELKSELALISVDGFVDLQQPWSTSRLQEARIRISDLSPSFNRVLENIEQLLSISLPRDEEGITLPMEGTLSEPDIAY